MSTRQPTGAVTHPGQGTPRVSAASRSPLL
jgi:hypothetical protein